MKSRLWVDLERKGMVESPLYVFTAECVTKDAGCRTSPYKYEMGVFLHTPVAFNCRR